MSTSLKIEHYDANVKYGLNIIDVDGLGFDNIPRNSESFVNVAGGALPHAEPGEKKITIYAEMTASSHSTLQGYLDTLIEMINPGRQNQRQVRLEFGNYSDRYYLAHCIGASIRWGKPRYSATYLQIILAFIIPSGFAIYNTMSLAALTGSPFSTMSSIPYTHNGYIPSRPRMVISNNNASNITNLLIMSTASRQKNKTIDVTEANVLRATGRWSDLYGAADIDSNGNISFAGWGNFTPAGFSVLCWVKMYVGDGNQNGYIWSTTGDTIYLRYDSTNSRWEFNYNGTYVRLADSATDWQHSEWWLIGCHFNGTDAILTMWDAEDGTPHRHSASDTPTIYRTIPTNFYIGSDASGTNKGDFYIDDLRILNYSLTNFVSEEAGNPLSDYEEATKSLPMGDGTIAYFSFDKNAAGTGWQNNELTIAATINQNDIFNIDCAKMTVVDSGGEMMEAPSDVMGDVSGEFPILLPRYNNFCVQYTGGGANCLIFGIEEKRKYA